MRGPCGNRGTHLLVLKILHFLATQTFRNVLTEVSNPNFIVISLRNVRNYLFNSVSNVQQRSVLAAKRRLVTLVFWFPNVEYRKLAIEGPPWIFKKCVDRLSIVIFPILLIFEYSSSLHFSNWQDAARLAQGRSHTRWRKLSGRSCSEGKPSYLTKVLDARVLSYQSTRCSQPKPKMLASQRR